MSRLTCIASLMGSNVMKREALVSSMFLALCEPDKNCLPTPLKSFTEIVRRMRKNLLVHEVAPSELVDLVEGFAFRLGLHTCDFLQDEASDTNGLPGVMTWTFGSLNYSIKTPYTVIRTTKPSWEAFKPFFW